MVGLIIKPPENVQGEILSPGESTRLGYCTTPDFNQIPPNSNGQTRPKPLQENIKTIGDWIKVNRQAKNLTPGQLGAKMGIAAGMVCNWERGTYRPEQLQIAAMESLFGVPCRITH